MFLIKTLSQTCSTSTVFWTFVGTLLYSTALSLHSSNEPGELSQWLCHDDSTINIVVVIIIIIIIIINTAQLQCSLWLDSWHKV